MEKLCNYLILDTETDGLYKDFSEPFTSLDNWPIIKQLAYIIADNEGNELVKKNFYINDPDEKKEILRTLITEIAEYRPVIVGHNIDFDANIIGAEFVRFGYYNHLLDCELICTMSSTVSYCELENFKWPKLQELHFKLFNTSFDGAHDALNDVAATSKCFFYLKKRNFEFESFQNKISNYSEYEKQINEKRHDRITNSYKAYALQELLRIFRLKKSDTDIYQELNFINDNFFRITIDKSFKGIYSDDNLSEVQRKFYLENEIPLIAKLGLDRLNSNLTDEAKEKMKKLPIGGDLFLFCYSNDYKNKIEDRKNIAKEFSGYLYSYELYLRANRRILPSANGEKLNVTMSDLVESLISKISNNQIAMTEVPNWLAMIFHHELYDLSKFKKEDVEGRKIEIKREIEQVKKIIEISKLKIKTKDEVLQFTAYLIHFYKAMPTEFKPETESIWSDFNKHYDKKDGCYIATLVYGSHLKNEVILLRQFRDLKLKKTVYGRLFVKIYYAISPSLVEHCRNKPFVNKVLKYTLDKIIEQQPT
jgi:DNA polymerase-3 subunit epsilon